MITQVQVLGKEALPSASPADEVEQRIAVPGRQRPDAPADKPLSLRGHKDSADHHPSATVDP
jgi:hypothetical protein